MKRDSITMVKLTASEGHMLTNGEAYGRVVFLPLGDDGSKWYEITEEEYEEHQKELEEKSKII